MKPCKGVERSPRGKGKGKCPTCGSEVAAHDLEGVLREELREAWSEAARKAAAEARKRHGSYLETRSPKQAERDAIAAKAHPEGTSVATTVAAIGGKSEKVKGVVIGHRRGQLMVHHPAHGTLMVDLDDVEK